MTKLLNHINTYADLTAYNNDMEKDYPNISYIKGSDEVKWVKDDPVHIVCKYNVTSTSEATTLLYSNSGISYQIIDGVRQDTIQTTYTFDTTGEHIVKYKSSGTVIRNIFRSCSALTSVTIPNSVTTIGSEAFYQCTGLTSVTIPNSVTTIGNEAFYKCTGLTSLTIPNSVTSIGTYTFRGCTSLTRIVVDSGNTKYDSRNNCNAIIETATNTLIQGCNTTIIPDTVTIIYYKAFENTTFKSVTIGDNVTELNNEAFYDMGELESVTIGSGVTSIGQRVFGMERVIINSKLTSITIYATTPPTFSEGLTTNRYNLTPTIYVPSESVDAYKAASGWSSYVSYIQPIP